MSSKKALGQELKCKIILLAPGEEIELGYNLNGIGQDLIDSVTKELDLLDKDYYGLKFHDQIQWLDPNKSLAKQVKDMSEIVFELRFKYYPAQPALLANESTRYYLYLQLRLDLIEGRLRNESQDTLAYLIACVLQCELGDFNPKETSPHENYLSEFKFVPNQTEDLEWAAIRLHQEEDFQGLGPADAELNFLKKACQLETYGIDPYPVKEGSSHNHFLIGVNHLGISAFQDSKRTNLFTWDEIDRIALDNKLVLIYCRKVERKLEKGSKSRPLFGFRCPSQAYAHSFWKIATEHRYFFTLESSPEAPIITNTGGIFKKNHKLKYTGRVERDLLRDQPDESRVNSGVRRSHSLISKLDDGPRWRGFQTGSSMQNQSMNNICASSGLNKTLPSNMNLFREEEEDDEAADQLESTSSQQYQNSQNQTTSDGKRHSSGASVTKDGGVKSFARRSVLTSKNETTQCNAIRRGSQIYMDTNQESNDLYKTTLMLFALIGLIVFVALIINDVDRPNSVSLIVKKMNLDRISRALRSNYYLPLKNIIGTQLMPNILNFRTN